MAISGTGTSQDPYVVTTLDELHNCPRDKAWTDNKMYINVDNDLDFNDDIRYKQDNYTASLISSGSEVRNRVLIIDFKGHKLDNCLMYSYTNMGPLISTSYSENIVIYNAIFQITFIIGNDFNDTYLSGHTNNYGGSIPVFFNCDFRIKYYLYTSYGYGAKILDSMVLKNCIFNAEIYYVKNSRYSTNTVYFVPFKDCASAGSSWSWLGIDFSTEKTVFNIKHIYSDDIDFGEYVTLFTPSSSNRTCFRDCAFFITINGIYAKPGDIYISGNNNCTYDKCYFVVRNISATNKATVKFCSDTGKSLSGNCFYDADVGTEVDFSMVSGMTGLTTLECKDATEISNLGFDTTNIWQIDPLLNEGYPSLIGNIGNKTDVFTFTAELQYIDPTKKTGYPVPYTEKPFSEVQEAPFPKAMMSCDPDRLEGYPSFEGALPFRPVQDQPYPALMMSCTPTRQNGYPVYVTHKPFRPVQDQPYPVEMMSCESDMIEGYPTYRRGKDFKNFGAGYLSEIEEIEIPYSVKYISDYAFWGTNIRSVKINRHCIYYAHSFPEGCHIKPYKDE